MADQINNFWHTNNRSDTVVILVHGIFSDSKGCWSSSGPNPTYWPDLIAEDVRLGDPDIYLAGYYTKLDAGPSEIQHCADEVFRGLSLPDSNFRDPPLTRKRLIFVCHSTGGIVVRHLLNQRARQFEHKEVGLLLLASPSGGSKWATRFRFLSRFYGYRLAQQLNWGSWSLSHIDDAFRSLLDQHLIPKLDGIEAFENRFIVSRRWLPNISFVVDRESACKYFGPARLLPGTDHFTAAKPESVNHPSHQLLLELKLKLDQQFGQPLADSIVIRPSEPVSQERDTGPNEDLWGEFVEQMMSEGSFFRIDPWTEATSVEELEFKKKLKRAYDRSPELADSERYQELLDLWSPMAEDPLFAIMHEVWFQRPFFISKIHEGLGLLFVAHAQLASGNTDNCGPALKYLGKFLNGNPYSMQKGDSNHLGPDAARQANESYRTILEFAKKWIESWGEVAFILAEDDRDKLPWNERREVYRDETEEVLKSIQNRIDEIEFIVSRRSKIEDKSQS